MYNLANSETFFDLGFSIIQYCDQYSSIDDIENDNFL